jgi:DNA-directed RNA polymerase subunit RPC12/RpoP
MKPEPDYRCPECKACLKGTYECHRCNADVREMEQ